MATPNDMGSGAHADEGWQHAAYVRKMVVQTTPTSSFTTASVVEHDTDSNCFTVDSVASSSSTWGTYMFLGGGGYSSANGCTSD